MKEFFLQMLNSYDPTISSGRFLTIITVLTILYTWAWVSLYTRVIHDIPVGVYTFAGLVIAGKTIGMFAEKQDTNTITTVETATKTTTGDSNANIQ
jgi:uncharacterized membrane-anchored protein YitT (DUF2179 family)